MSEKTLAARENMRVQIWHVQVWHSLAIIFMTVCIVLISLWNRQQQHVIDQLIANAQVAEAYDVSTEYYLGALQATIDRHIEEGCIAQAEEATIMKRIDLAVRQVDQMTREFQ